MGKSIVGIMMTLMLPMKMMNWRNSLAFQEKLLRLFLVKKRKLRKKMTINHQLKEHQLKEHQLKEHQLKEHQLKELPLREPLQKKPQLMQHLPKLLLLKKLQLNSHYIDFIITSLLLDLSPSIDIFTFVLKRRSTNKQKQDL